MMAVVFFALLGLAVNLAWPQAQPDWAAAVLLGALLARVQCWRWVIPLLAWHDAVLFGQGWGMAALAALAAWGLPRIDQRIGPGAPQRFVFALLAAFPLAWHGWGVLAQWMTVLATIAAWQWASEQGGRRAFAA